MRIDYRDPIAWADGMVVGRANLDIHRHNDQYFFGLQRRAATIVQGSARQVLNVATSVSAATFANCPWYGFHYLESDATLFHYKFGVETSGAIMTLVYDLGGDDQTTIATATGTGTFAWTSGTYDLSDFATGLYRVALVNTDTLGVGYCYPPYTTYTAQDTLNYQTPPICRDGETPDAIAFNAWSNNDRYMDTNRPRQPAFVGISRSYPGTDTSIGLWDSYHRFRYPQISYRVWLGSVADTDIITLYWDYGGDNELSNEIATEAGYSEDTWDIPTAYQPPPGTWIRIAAILSRSTTGPGTTAQIDYLRIGQDQDAEPSGYTVMDPFTVGQWVYGDREHQDTRLQLLSDNDNFIFPRLCWNANIGRYDWAVAQSGWPGYTGTQHKYALQRRYDTLRYRVTDAKLQWGTDNSYNLDDYDDDNWTGDGVAYQELDLNDVEDLAHGQTYYIVSDGGYLEYAQER